MATAVSDDRGSIPLDGPGRQPVDGVGPPTTDAIISTLVSGALREVAGAAAVGLAVLDARGTITTHAPTSSTVEDLHASQSRLGEGPCLDALPGVGPRPGPEPFTHAPDLSGGAYWPRWSREVRAAGFHEILSFPIVGARSYAALTLYGTGRHRIRRDEALTVAVFAAHLGDLLGAPCWPVLPASDGQVLHHATGVLAERHRLGAARAFGLLVATAQHTDQHLRDTARRMVGPSATAPELTGREV